jgi:glycogen(starch) synthase
VHAHDWLVAQTAITLAETTRAPLVATMHATEAGRHAGWLPHPLNRAIHSVERWLAERADTVVTCSTSMHDEVTSLFEIDPAKVAVVPNAIDAERWRPSAAERSSGREQYRGSGPLLVFAGRLVHEKGLQTLFAALPALRRRYPGLRVAIAGSGVHEAALRAQARRLRVVRSVDWLGFVPESRLPALFAAADVAVVPSSYEPFGIVALEAAVAATPLVVAETGGLADLVRAGVAVGSFPAGDVPALTAALDAVLADPVAARRRARRAARIVARDYTWAAVAERMLDVYGDAVTSTSRPTALGTARG